MRLPIPFTFGDRTWSEAEVGRVKAGTLADTKVVADTGDYFGAIHAMLSGCMTSMTDSEGAEETDRGQLRVALKEMPSVDAEYLSIEALLMTTHADAIEGAYDCPRCGAQIVSEGEFADRISDLQVIEGEVDERLEIALRGPVVVNNRRTGETVVSVEVLELRQPTVRDYMRAFSQVGTKDPVRFQYAAYAQAIISVSGKSVDDRWRAQWGAYLMELMDSEDVSEIARKIRSRGRQTTVPKTCNKCGKRWDAEVSMAGFFASAVFRKS